MREHNRIAKELEYLNPEWDDDHLFFETRRIVVAELQVITYNEFLPAVLGDLTLEEFDLTLAKDGYSYDYDQRVDPSVTNEFATAAFRFGHSMVDGLLKYDLIKLKLIFLCFLLTFTYFFFFLTFLYFFLTFLCFFLTFFFLYYPKSIWTKKNGRGDIDTRGNVSSSSYEKIVIFR